MVLHQVTLGICYNRSNQQWIYVHRWKDYSQYPPPHKVGQLWSKIIFICSAKLWNKHSLSRYDVLQCRQTSKVTKKKTLFVWYWTVPRGAQILYLNFIKYYSSWLHVSSQLSLLDGYFIIRKYSELNHHDRAQININSDKNLIQWLLFSFQTIISW
jgi:hypothetical protein